MAHHVTETNPTRPLGECGSTTPFFDDHRNTRWHHMCGLNWFHGTDHRCGECGEEWKD